MNNTQSSRGGAGRGQGRKLVGKTEPTVRLTVRFSQSQMEWLSKSGNASEKVRELVQKAMNG